MQKAKESGIDAYHAEQREKKKILNQLLECYDDGSQAAFFCLAVNMIEVKELKRIMARLNEQRSDISLSEKANLAEAMLRECTKKI